MEKTKSSFAKPAINFLPIEPNAELLEVYEEKYKRFIKYQTYIS
jgi:hypothetical protein